MQGRCLTRIDRRAVTSRAIYICVHQEGGVRLQQVQGGLLQARHARQREQQRDAECARLPLHPQLAQPGLRPAWCSTHRMQEPEHCAGMLERPA